MAAGETFPSDWSELGLSLDLGTPEIDPNDPILTKIFNNYCDLHEITGIPLLLAGSERDRFEHSLFASKNNNSLALIASSEQPNQTVRVPLGYFWGGECILYPELFDLTESQDISMELDFVTFNALLTRAESIEKFNNDPPSNAPRLDYNHPIVVALQYEMAEHLDEEMVNELLDRHHYLEDKPEKPHKALHADEYTRADVCIRTVQPTFGQEGAGEPRVEDSTISIRMHGAYTEIPDTSLKLREPTFYIDVAKRRPVMLNHDKKLGLVEGEDYIVPDFEDGFRVINRLISSYDLENYVALAQRVRDVAAEFKKQGIVFSKDNLGPFVRPTSLLP